MKIPRAILEQMIREELAKHIKALTEADHRIMDAQEDKADEEEPGKKGPGRPPGAKNKPKLEPNKTPDNTDAKGKPERKIGSPAQKPPEQPPTEEPEDDELEKDVDSEEDSEDAEDVTGGEIADQLAGKTVQSITMEPKSKLMPGAQEVVITFSQIPDPLRILVTKSGGVKFYFKGLHNEL